MPFLIRGNAPLTLPGALGSVPVLKPDVQFLGHYDCDLDASG